METVWYLRWSALDCVCCSSCCHTTHTTVTWDSFHKYSVSNSTWQCLFVSEEILTNMRLVLDYIDQSKSNVRSNWPIGEQYLDHIDQSESCITWLAGLRGWLCVLRIIVANWYMKGTELVCQAPDGVGSVGVRSVEVGCSAVAVAAVDWAWKTDGRAWRVPAINQH